MPKQKTKTKDIHVVSQVETKVKNNKALVRQQKSLLEVMRQAQRLLINLERRMTTALPSELQSILPDVQRLFKKTLTLQIAINHEMTSVAEAMAINGECKETINIDLWTRPMTRNFYSNQLMGLKQERHVIIKNANEKLNSYSMFSSKNTRTQQNNLSTNDQVLTTYGEEPQISNQANL